VLQAQYYLEELKTVAQGTIKKLAHRLLTAFNHLGTFDRKRLPIMFLHVPLFLMASVISCNKLQYLMQLLK
jgi:hypothetical protein